MFNHFFFILKKGIVNSLKMAFISDSKWRIIGIMIGGLTLSVSIVLVILAPIYFPDRELSIWKQVFPMYFPLGMFITQNQFDQTDHENIYTFFLTF